MTAEEVEALRRRFCAIHARHAPPEGCEACRRMAAIGVLVGEVLGTWNGWRLTFEVLDALDAVAYLLTDHAKLVRAHRKERNEDAREASRDARAAYDQGRDERGPGW